jgi:hypothetical protein
MTIGEIVREGLHYARTCRSLWLFGFFVGIWSGGSSGSSGGGGGHGGADGAAGAAVAAGAAMAGGLQPSLAYVVPIALVILLAITVGLVMRFIGEGALIEGIVRARQGGTLTTREGFRAGWAHWGVLLRIALLYFAASAGSVALLAAPCVLAAQTIGWVAALLLGIPAALVAVPWLVTLYLVQAFASRIAVLEDRRALDALRKARLFLHGRLAHGLRLMVATLIGTLVIAVLTVAVLVPVALLLAALSMVVNVLPLIVIGCVVLLPVFGVLTAMLGTYRSSVWTIGYVTQVNA